MADEDFPTAHQLNLIAAVARHGGVSAAATALSISQPAVTAQIQAAERTLGVELFTRARDGLRLTAAGQIVVDYVGRHDALRRGMFAALAELRTGAGGTLLIGSSTTPAEYYLPSWLKGFRQAYPRVDVRVAIANSEETLKRLERGDIDVAIVGVAPPAQFQSSSVGTDELILFAATDSPWARDSNAKNLVKAPFVLREEGSATRKFAMASLAHLRATPVSIMSLNSNEAVARIVEAGMGIGVLSRRAIERHVAEGRLAEVPLNGWECKRELYLARLSEAHNVLVDKFWQFVDGATRLPSSSA